MTNQQQKLLRQLPGVDYILNLPLLQNMLGQYPRRLVLEAIRQLLENLRLDIREGRPVSLEDTTLETGVQFLVGEVVRPNLRRVINATGVVLHTNLGRAVLSENAIKAVTETARGYSNLELDLATGERGSRYAHVEQLLCKLTGAEAALVVNNNAAAVMLALGALASGREVVVSRGQLVEIGGAFRIPDVMVQSGCTLREVGTTNKTHLRDYAGAINDNTALLLKVHTSNYRVVGFTSEVSLAELVTLGNEHGIPVVEDLGSGFLIDLESYGVGDEPTVQASITQGAHVVTFSGDKLLGGPQAGIIVGRKDLITAMKKHPLTRAVRIDKLTLAALEATLREYLDETMVRKTVPTLNMLTCSSEEITQKASELELALKRVFSGPDLMETAQISLSADFSQVGGGAMPLLDIPTTVVKVHPLRVSVGKWAEKLRKAELPIIVRVGDNSLILDPRTLFPGDSEAICKTLKLIATEE